MLTHIDLFSGIGGFALAAQWAGFETLAFVEIEPYAQEIIKQNFGAVADAKCDGRRRSCERQNARGSLCEASKVESRESELGRITEAADCCRPRIYGDIFQFNGTAYRGATLLTGGFPCQPFSQAGKRRGKEDDRYLWPEMLRIIHEARPAWVLGENVAGIVTMELDRVLSDLEGEGYAVQPLIIPACAVDAKHRRDRVWIVGHADTQHEQEQRITIASAPLPPRPEQRGEALADDGGDISGRDSRSGRWQREHGEAPQDGRRGSRQTDGVWLPEPDVGRVAHGIPARVDRLKGLGNAIVPQAAFEIIREIAEIERHGYAEKFGRMRGKECRHTLTN